jgi:hypothetical protein
MQATGEQGAQLCNRAMRRRKGRLQQGIVQSLVEGPGAPGEKRKARMLETHVWHAKRMRMTTRCSSSCNGASFLGLVCPESCGFLV